jgi:tetratricopeptide (TPR) repeat protein
MKGPSNEELEQRCSELFTLAQWCGSRGRYDEQRQHAADALTICRLLRKRAPDDVRHVEALAGGLYNQAGRWLDEGEAVQADALLVEADECYAELAAADPTRFTVRRLDVRQRSARVHVLARDWTAASRRYRETIALYQDAPTDDPVERDFGIVRAHTGLGYCLLALCLRSSAMYQDALDEFDAALFMAEGLREQAGIEATEFSWLADAPQSFRHVAPEWISAAVCAMELHEAAGRRDIAADAANIAVRVCGALAAIGDDTLHHRFELILKRAKEIWYSAEHPARAAALRVGPYQEVLVGGGLGPSTEPDIDRMLTLAGWTDLQGDDDLPATRPGHTAK